MLSERGYDIIMGPGKVAQERLQNFATEQGYDTEIGSPEVGKILIYLRGDSGELLKDTPHYETFLNQFLLLDDKFSRYTDEFHTKWTIRIAQGKFGPCIEAYYL
jgi:hypothetical protein